MNYILNFNGLRGILAMLVVFAHVSQNQICGKYAVCTFFVLSGFLYGLKYSLNEKRIQFKNILNSMSKLYPGYFITLVLFALMAVFLLHKDLLVIVKSFFAHIFFFQTWVPHTWFELLNSPTWFLSAYFGILLIFFVVQERYILLFSFLLLTMVLCVFVSEIYWLFFVSPYMRFYDFIIAYFCGKLVGKRNQFDPSCIKQSFLFLVTILSIVATIICRIIYWDLMPDSIKYSFIYLPSSIVVVCVCYVTEKCNLSFFLKSRVLQYLGSISMQLYIYHWFFARIFFYVFPSASIYVSFLVVVALSVLTAHFMKKYVEKRIYDIVQKRI